MPLCKRAAPHSGAFRELGRDADPLGGRQGGNGCVSVEGPELHSVLMQSVRQPSARAAVSFGVNTSAESAGRAAVQPLPAAGGAGLAGLYWQEGSCGGAGSAAKEERQFLGAFSPTTSQQAEDHSCTEDDIVGKNYMYNSRSSACTAAAGPTKHIGWSMMSWPHTGSRQKGTLTP